MFQAIGLALCLLLTDPAVAGSAPPPAHAQQASAYLQASVKLEVDALSGVVRKMGNLLEAGEITCPPATRKAHNDGKALWQEAKALSEAGNYPEAYGKLRDAWAAHKPATEFVSEHVGNKPMEELAKQLIATISTRLDDVKGHVSGSAAPAPGLYTDAKGQYQVAKTARQEGKGRKAFNQALDAIRTLDDCLQATWK